MAALDNSQTIRRATVPEWLRQGESRLRLQTIVRLRWLAGVGPSPTLVGAPWGLGGGVRVGVTVARGALTIAAATVLTSVHHPLPWFHQTNLLLPFPYVMGVWAAVVSGILFIGFYSWRTAEGGRRMAKALAAAEMVLARLQKLSALDGLAAAAAHGLGTPLATIAVVTKELMRDAKPSDPPYADLVLLRAQAERCREI